METFFYHSQPNENILCKEENRMIRMTTGQLSWASSQTWPDLAHDALFLSTIANRATFIDAKDSGKVVEKAKKCPYHVKFHI